MPTQTREGLEISVTDGGEMIAGSTEEMPFLMESITQEREIYFIHEAALILATRILSRHTTLVPLSSVALKLWENHKLQRMVPLRTCTLPKNFDLDISTRQRIQRQIDLGHQQDPAAVIAYAMMLLDIEEDWIGCPRTPAPVARVLHTRTHRSNSLLPH
jgi:hypothetical protein